MGVTSFHFEVKCEQFQHRWETPHIAFTSPVQRTAHFLSEDVEEAGGNCWGKLNSDSDHADDNPE